MSIRGWIQKFGKMMSSSSANEPKNKAVSLTCTNCSQQYVLGKDALAMTQSGGMESIASEAAGVTVLSGGAKSLSKETPDLVDTCDWNTLRRAGFYRGEIEKISSSLEANVTRWWKCQKCLHVQEYPGK